MLVSAPRKTVPFMCKQAYRPRLTMTGINGAAHAGERMADKLARRPRLAVTDIMVVSRGDEHMVDNPTADLAEYTQADRTNYHGGYHRCSIRGRVHGRRVSSGGPPKLDARRHGQYSNGSLV